MHIGLICPELSGHLNPMTTLGRELTRRGHRVTVIARADARKKVEATGLGFAVIAEEQFPVGAMNTQTTHLGKLSGMAAIRYTVEMLRLGTEVILRDAAPVIAREGIEGLLVDQVAPAGATIAERLSLPYVTVCNALAINPDPAIPPAVLPWRYHPGIFGRLRNATGNALLHRLASPVVKLIDADRADHGLRKVERGMENGSPLAQIAQQPEFFDYPRTRLPDCFHYTGPWHDQGSGDEIPFPWKRLDGRPLVYASMGTLQNKLEFIFTTIAEAMRGIDAQLVMALGSRQKEAVRLAERLDGEAIVVPFAPQLALLEKATLTITHAGLNTTLESLSRGLPMVAIPITNDQPGVASRLEWLGIADVIQPGKLSVEALRTTVQRVLREPKYRENAQRRQKEIAALNGLRRAGDIAEQALTTGKPVLRLSAERVKSANPRSTSVPEVDFGVPPERTS